jgi:hypothetical protein
MRRDALALLIVCAGWCLAVATVLPPKDLGFMPEWIWTPSLDRLNVALNGLNVFARAGRLSVLVSMAILLVALARSTRCTAVAGFLGVSVGGIFAFFYTRYPGLIWHRGLIFMALFAAIWIDRISMQDSISGTLRKPLVPGLIFGALLVIQAVEGAAAIQRDLRQPLSNGRAAAQFIGAQGWLNDPLIAAEDITAVPIIGYLGVDKAFFANGQRWGSFTVWDQTRLQPTDMTIVMNDSIRFGPAATLIVSADTSVDQALLRRYGFSEVLQLDGAAVARENYVIYRRSNTMTIAVPSSTIGRLVFQTGGGFRSANCR